MHKNKLFGGAPLAVAAYSLIAILGGVAHAQTVWSGNPVADAFVTTGPTGNLSNSNYGGAGGLGVSGTGAIRTGIGFRGVFDSVLRFDFAAAKSNFDATYGVGLWTVQSINLKLSTTNPLHSMFNNHSTGLFSILWMQNDGWNAGTGTPNAPGASGITYNSLPSFLSMNDQSLGTFAFDSLTAGADGFNSTYSLQLSSGVLSDVLGGSLASFELAAASTDVSYLFNSIYFPNSSRWPLMTITAIAAIPEPSEWGMLGIGCALLVIFRKASGRRANPVVSANTLTPEIPI
jgi:hypothetical protein